MNSILFDSSASLAQRGHASAHHTSAHPTANAKARAETKTQALGSMDIAVSPDETEKLTKTKFSLHTSFQHSYPN